MSAVILVFRASQRCDQETGLETARTGKSCVKPVAVLELFNPTVPAQSIQIVNEQLDTFLADKALFFAQGTRWGGGVWGGSE